MASGGARNRSGPPADPNSGRSDRRGQSFTSLPMEGYQGVIPDFPLQPIVLFSEHFEDGKKVREKDEDRSDDFSSREAEVWVEAWRTPQAAAWARQSWRWPIIAEYCRLKTVIEFDPSANASLVAQLHRYRDQIGLTPAGMRDNGWAVAVDDTSGKREEKSKPDRSQAAPPKRRLRAVSE